jgi:hypothetical protein
MSDKVSQLLDVIGRQNLAIEKLIAERDELRQHLENLAPGSPDAHACLRRIYNDPEAKDAERRSAATAAIGYEKPKPAATVNNIVSFERYYATIEQNWQKTRAERAKVIEPPKPKAPIDWDAPTPGTILGHDGEGGPDAA